MENLTGGTPPVRYLPCVVPCKLYFETAEIHCDKIHSAECAAFQNFIQLFIYRHMINRHSFTDYNVVFICKCDKLTEFVTIQCYRLFNKNMLFV